METPSRFNLNEAIRHWRVGLESSPVFRAENLDELEAHLRDSTASLEARGLSAAEGFLVAARRLGSRADLEREFGKANAREVWLDRSLWMVAGLLIFWVVNRVVAFAPQTLVLQWGLASNLSAPWAAWLFMAAQWTLPFAGVAGVWWFCLGKRRSWGPWARWSLRRWWLSGPILVGLLYASHPLAYKLRELMNWLLPLGAGSPRLAPNKFELMRVWLGWMEPLGAMLWTVLVVVMAAFLQRFRRTELDHGLNPAPPPVSAIQACLVEQYQSKGLSPEEARLLAAQSGGGLAAPASEPADFLVQAERGLWMLAGIVFTYFWLWPFLLEPCWLVASMSHRLVTRSPVHGHMLGGLSLLLELAVAGICGVLFWRSVTRSRGVSQWLGSLILRSPAAAAGGLAGIYGLLKCCTWLLQTAVWRQLGPGISGTAADWYFWQYSLLQMILPVALLLWLGRARMRSHTA